MKQKIVLYTAGRIYPLYAAVCEWNYRDASEMRKWKELREGLTDSYLWHIAKNNSQRDTIPTNHDVSDRDSLDIKMAQKQPQLL